MNEEEEEPAAEEERSPVGSCDSCGQVFYVRVRFCSSCGSRQIGIDYYEAQDTFNRYLRIAGIFFGLHLVSMLIGFLFIRETGESDSIILFLDILLALVTLSFCILLRKELRPLFKWPLFNPYFWAGLVLLFPFSFWVSISTDHLNELLGEYDDLLIYFTDSPHWILISFIMIVPMPAIFEELAFRGVLQTSLERIMKPTPAMLTAAFAFFIIHLSFLSVYWLFPFAVLLGWLRMRYGNLYYGMIVHALHNATVFVLANFDLISEYLGF